MAKKDEKIVKAIDPKDIERIKSSESLLGPEHVDHISQIAEVPTDSEHFNQIKSHTTPRHTHDQSIGGLGQKAVYNSAEHKLGSENKKFMIKPYFKTAEPGTESYGVNPIAGWASLTNKKLYEAANIPHLHEKVSGHVENSTPVTVHEFEGDKFKSASRLDTENKLHHIAVNPLHLQQIALMDYLAENKDRHMGNIIVEDTTKRTKPSDDFAAIKAIDHERNFQYPTRNDTSIPAENFHFSTGIKNLAQHTIDHTDEDELHGWFQKHKHNIKNEFHNQLKHIKNEDLKNRLKDNFDQRWDVLNTWAETPQDVRPSVFDRESSNGAVNPVKQEKMMPNMEKLDASLPADTRQAIKLLSEYAQRHPKSAEALNSLISKRLNTLKPKELVDLWGDLRKRGGMNWDKLFKEYKPEGLGGPQEYRNFAQALIEKAKELNISHKEHPLLLNWAKNYLNRDEETQKIPRVA